MLVETRLEKIMTCKVGMSKVGKDYHKVDKYYDKVGKGHDKVGTRLA